jgi:superfamily II DNA or RNA helicase
MAWDLRRCQREPLADWASRQPDDFLAVITPGGGKTRFAAAAAKGALDSGLVRRVGVVVPTTALKVQWAEEFADIANLSLESRYRTGARLASDRAGCIVTYAQLLDKPQAFARLWEGALLIHDEIHHAGSDSTWGQCLEIATEDARNRIHLSGTPFRSDRTAIAHLHYDDRGFVIPDYSYGYRDALDDGIVRPIVAHPQGGSIKWVSPSTGEVHEATIDDTRVTGRAANERLRGLLTSTEWLVQVIKRGDAMLQSLRKREPDAGALIAAIDEKHARQIERVVLDTLGIAPCVVVSADPDADAALLRYKKGNEPYIIAIRKVSEGIDIKRLRMEFYLTNARKPLIFNQLAGRIVRARNGDTRPSYLLYPADPTITALVRELEAQIKGENTGKPAATATPPEQEDGDESAGSGGGGVEVLDVAYVELDPYLAVQATVDPDALFSGKPADDAAPAAIVGAYVDDHERLEKVLRGLVGEVSHRFTIPRKDVYAYWKGLRGSQEAATAQELQRRITAMRKWLEVGQHPMRSKFSAHR